MSSPQFAARAQQFTMSPSKDQHVFLIQSHLPGRRDDAAVHSQRISMWTHLGCSESAPSISPLALPAPLLPATAQTCCAPIRDVEQVDEASRRHLCACSAGSPQRKPPVGSLRRHAAYAASGLSWWHSPSRQHALEMNYGPAASLPFSYWAPACSY